MGESTSTVNLKAVPFQEQEKGRKPAFEDTSAWKKLSVRLETEQKSVEETTTLRPPQTVRIQGADWQFQRAFLSDPDSPKYLLQELLGRGRSSLILTGQQQSLRRTVAFKRSSLSRQADGQDSLTQEALVTASLEHPNIIPVYDLTWDEEGCPLMVMKQVEGSTWSSYLSQRPAFDNPRWSSWLRRQIQVLLEVCKALQYAHKHNIVHLGLKTDDIMLGDFGEVHIIDWGLAQVLKSGESQPPSNEALPPGELYSLLFSEKLSERTDIFLLGMLLFEVLTGQPPVLCSDSPRKLDLSPLEDKPRLLREICEKAMDPDPEQRYQNVEVVQKALQEYLQHWSSIQISSQAVEKLTLLKQQIQDFDDEQKHREETDRLFAQCHFGFSQALELWKGNKEALHGLQESIETMIRFYLDQEAPAQVESLLHQLPQENPQLESEWRNLSYRLKVRQNELQKLRQLQKDYDPEVDAQLRRRSPLLLSGIGFVLILGIVVFLWQTTYTLSTEWYMVLDGVWLLSMSFLGWLGRKEWFGTQVNRHLGMILFLDSVARLVLRGFALHQGMTLYQSFSMIYMLQFAIFSIIALFYGWRLFVCSGIYLLALVLSLFVHSQYWLDFMVDIPVLLLLARWYQELVFQNAPLQSLNFSQSVKSA